MKKTTQAIAVLAMVLIMAGVVWATETRVEFRQKADACWLWQVDIESDYIKQTTHGNGCVATKAACITRAKALITAMKNIDPSVKVANIRVTTVIQDTTIVNQDKDDID